MLSPWRSRRLWSSLVHTALDLPVGVVVSVPTIALSGATLGLAVALPIAVVTGLALAVWTKGVGHVERSRTNSLLGTTIQNAVQPLPKGPILGRGRALITSRERWRLVAYSLLRLPLSLVMFPIVIGSWAVSVALTSLPATVFVMPQDTARFGMFEVGVGFGLVVACLCGVAGLVVVAPWLTTVAADIDARFASRFLGPRHEIELKARAEKAEAGRTAAVDAAEAERRRIERDLHDGAQQRLVALAVDLGAARERLDSDPDGAKTLVAQAHDEAKAALAEIRDLVRGIYPAILEDRGLDAALSAVVARSPIPVNLTVNIDGRPPDVIESAAYFVVSEALANVARHAEAAIVHVAIVSSGERLVVEVRDDGRGGAEPSKGSGLTGLADRVASLGGTMDLLSPPGGPTTLLVELPCAS